jgi:uncharacterized protein
LTAAQFDGLAAGYGDAGAIGLLRAGQASRRRLLLRAVAETVPATAAAMSLLTTVARVAPAIADEMLTHPVFDAWATGCLHAVRTGGDVDAGYLNGFVAALAARAGVPFTLPVPLRGGEVCLPTLGNAYGWPEEARNGWASATGDGSRLRIEGHGHGVTVAAPYRAGAAGWQARRHMLSHGIRLGIEDLDGYRDCFQWPPRSRLSTADAQRFADLIDDALSLVVRHHPRHAEAIDGTLLALVPLTCPTREQSVSAAARLAFGAIGVSIPDDAPTLALLLIHEFQHMKLGGLLDIVDLYRPDGEARHHAPWRADPRPVGALLQGVYAHVGVTDFWRVRRRTCGGHQARLAQVEFAYWLAQTRAAADTLAGSGELTAAGVRFVDRLLSTLEGWRSEPVPVGVTDGVADLVGGSTVLWRLRNHTPAAPDAPRLAGAFARGESCPVVAPAERVASAYRGPDRPFALGELIRGTLVTSAPHSAVPGPDGDYVRGDFRAAMAGYEQRIGADPDEAEAWAGLALTLRRAGDRAAATALWARPDLVCALVKQTGAGPVAVAGWLSPAVAPPDGPDDGRATVTAGRYRSPAGRSPGSPPRSDVTRRAP